MLLLWVSLHLVWCCLLASICFVFPNSSHIVYISIFMFKRKTNKQKTIQENQNKTKYWRTWELTETVEVCTRMSNLKLAGVSVLRSKYGHRNLPHQKILEIINVSKWTIIFFKWISTGYNHHNPGQAPYQKYEHNIFSSSHKINIMFSVDVFIIGVSGKFVCLYIIVFYHYNRQLRNICRTFIILLTRAYQIKGKLILYKFNFFIC